jgi:benzil reductase ((S)-benzoin forming)
MNYYIITGTSRGLGKAMAEVLLQEKENKVIGISRGQSINHKNYKHLCLDLSDTDLIKKNLDQIFPVLTDADEVVLINNAGMLGQVGQVGNIENDNFEKLYKVNLIAPVILMNEFIKRYKELKVLKKILNISSGAGKKPVDGWSGYCSSKSALDMFSLVVDEEQRLINQNFIVFSVAPGIVDTEMQSDIRKASKANFSRVEEFKSYKEHGDLVEARLVAGKIIYLLKHPKNFGQVINSARDIAINN